MNVDPTKIAGSLGTLAQATSITSAFLVAVQRINFDVAEMGTSSLFDRDLLSLPFNTEKRFLFTSREDDTVELSSDITDHYTENNEAFHDEIALKPEIISLRGFVGELSDETRGILRLVNTVSSQLTVLAPYAPEVTASTLKMINRAKQIYSAAASSLTTVTEAVELVATGSFENSQQKAYQFFKSRWKSRTLFRVQTPWEIFPNMAIQSLRVTQDNETGMISDFAISFKKINFASTALYEQTIKQARLAAQASDTKNLGVQNPTDIGPVASVLGDSSAIQSTVFA